MNVFATIRKVFGLQPKDTTPAPQVTTFEYPTFNLPNLPGMTTTVHTRAVLTERVECSISKTPVHDMKIVIVDNVVKSISPCDRVSALAAAQLGGESCARRYQEIRAWLLGEPKQWGNIVDARDPLDGPIEVARRRRLERKQRRALPTGERIPPRVWEQFIQQTTGLVACVSVYGENLLPTPAPAARVYIETPGVQSFYSFTGSGWALGQGPGDLRVYDLLNKHVKLDAKLVKYL